MANSKYFEVSAEVRYWEDATVNGVEDTTGSLIPCRNNKVWEPIIRISDGLIINWTKGTTANIHYKVCDAGLYWLLDHNKNRIAQYPGHYVPDSILCPLEKGHGDYIIMNVDSEGYVVGWNPDLEKAGF